VPQSEISRQHEPINNVGHNRCDHADDDYDGYYQAGQYPKCPVHFPLPLAMRRFTRLTNAFSKKFENHCHALALYFFWYNFCRVHKTLGVTPAMASGLVDHVLKMETAVAMIDAPRAGSGWRPLQKTGCGRTCEFKLRHYRIFHRSIPGPKRKRPGAWRARSRTAPEMGGYFSELLMVSKFVLSLVPRPFTAVMIAIAIPAAIRPYSMAVAPDSSLKNDLMTDFIAGSDLGFMI
jgi:hypothetical protein